MKLLRSLFLMMLICSPSLARTIKLDSSNTLVIQDSIMPGWAESNIARLQKLEKRNKKKPIYLLFACPGGYLDEMEKFVDYAKNIPSLESITIVGYSGCAFIPVLLSGKRYGVEGTDIMFHEIKFMLNQGTYTYRDIEAIYKEFTKNTEVYALLAKGLNMPLEQYNKLTEVDWFIKGPDLLKYNVVHELVNLDCGTKQSGNVSPELYTYLDPSLIFGYTNCLSIGE